jgi:ABC-type multidrug transport system ATPase subunit
VNPRKIVAEGLVKRHGSLLALDGVGFELEERRSLAVVGPNGAGKSSLLRILAGVSLPDEGRIAGLEDFRVGYLPDTLDLPAGASAKSWLAWLARLKGAVRGRRAANDLALRVLAEAGLAEAAGRDAATFSRGMKQRLAFAQAILGEPDLLIMDEPTSALDPVWATWWRERLLRLRSSGTTLILSTHRLDELDELSDSFILLLEGKVASDEDSSAWLAEAEGGRAARRGDAGSGRFVQEPAGSRR